MAKTSAATKAKKLLKNLEAFKKPDHSDWLIHWTGFDLDREHDPEWWKPKGTELNKNIVQPYLDRLKWTLRYGLWMMKDEDPIRLKMSSNHVSYKRPQVSRTCFTELKLSEVQTHALRFGRLGIGFKRMFVFERMGLPMIYYRAEKMNWHFLHKRSKKREFDDLWTCYLKSMSENSPKNNFINYQQYEESEWRIIYSEQIKKQLAASSSAMNNFFIKPATIRDADYCAYLSKSKKRPDYLIPLSANDPNPSGEHKCRWMAIIIYPNLAVKVAAEADPEIRTEINRRKPVATVSDLMRLKNSASYESHSKPVEIDLQACRQI